MRTPDLVSASELVTTDFDLVHAFFDRARRYPNEPAIISNGEPLSYGELAALARELADRLGPEPGVVGVLTTRSPATIVALLGTLAAGGTYCPIDAVAPDDRRRVL